ncbi:methylated-DNA--[protein]-cysteine S-methyltransferase [Dongshaea marina]|uniref:methylated-DNA--[protein]-cysteine S-methyltransferase n=1 Tax=Dongshaea marina TaxID=2047966 RepID=UPI000D3E8010|nr:methylated-DNA--[protein]-cysteine S-methyltransferase [Dongshaea marina]
MTPLSSLNQCSIETPIGWLTLEANQHALLRVSFTPEPVASPCDTPVLREAGEQLTAYFAGRLQQFSVPLSIDDGTEFRQKCWRALQTIPYGETRCYSEQAEQIGSPKAARAVGQANHHNPLSIIIPCHRVIGRSGQLVGYGGGLDRKIWLLAHEKNFMQSSG